MAEDRGVSFLMERGGPVLGKYWEGEYERMASLVVQTVTPGHRRAG
jgi:hypothetical protein